MLKAGQEGRGVIAHHDMMLKNKDGGYHMPHNRQSQMRGDRLADMIIGLEIGATIMNGDETLAVLDLEVSALSVEG